jgi:penicillin-binding protein 2
MRTIFPLLLVSLFLAGCGTSGPTGEGPAVTDTLPGPQVSTELAPDPEMIVSQFLNAWKQAAYDEMYALLSPLTQDSVTQDVFQERYKEIWQAGAFQDLEFEIVSSLIQNPRQAQVRFRLVLDSVAVGSITRDAQMDLTRVDQNWTISWTSVNILPELDNDRGLLLDTIAPTRANIYDRNGLALAAQVDAVALWIVPNRVGDEDAEDAMLATLRRLLDFPSTETIRFKYDNIRGTDFRVVLGEVPLEDFQQVQGTLNSTGGVDWGVYNTRLYFDGGLAAHSLGYISWIQEAQLQDYLALGYRGDEYVGQVGLELEYESDLRGKPSSTLYLTDGDGQPLNALASVPSEPPYAVYTHLDRDLQRYAQQALEDSGLVGAAVVLDRDSGAVLAIASSPSFDPNIFDTNNPNSFTALEELYQGTSDPLINRATQGLYPPGSVFKMITMAAGLEAGLFQPETIFNCKLVWERLPGFPLYDWRFEKELPAAGEISLIEALELSCNPYFYEIGWTLFQNDLPTAISDMAKGFGLGELTGIEIGEAAGLVPDPASKVELLGETWALRDSIQISFGQSFLQVTPLQVARYVAAIGNGGTLYRPQLVSRIQNAEGETIHEFQPEVQGMLPISDETLAAIQEGMLGVVRDPPATAYRRFLGLDVDLAGKTGTATTGDFTESHAWFTGYTFEEREDLPDIAVVVLVEFAGEGSEVAAPIFRRIVEAYFKGRPLSVYPWEDRIRIPKTPTPEPEEDATPEP